MGVWYIVLLSVMIRVAATDHPPNNPPFAFDEVNVAAETRILERVSHLLQSLSDKIKIRIDEMKRDVSRIILQQDEFEDMSKITNKSLGKVSEQLQSFQTSTKEAMINLKHNFGRFPEDTGIYYLQPNTAINITFEVSRDWTNNHGFGGDWIVFQRRFNGSVNFYRNWSEYKQGFGDLRGEHWLGLDKLHSIVKTRQHELFIVLEDFDGVIAYAHYDDFKIGDESEKYKIKSLGQYTGTAGDSFSYHRDEVFSTYDQDNDKDDKDDCAVSYGGAWWFKKCYYSHLNGEYLKGKSNRAAGIIWYTFRGHYYSLKSTKMMVRPVA
ncbi:fibrinogen C domain-containing protein 1-like [Anopheles moucheti]|uniref:fibrinogen C domain-containing protein 1-like n=1 Tax=Anopheles moucheti TaxID=186751 RepID=UPI0022F0D315|nr:fibrinogen C domain-containing protein 1-like [Anopheles moucheti]